MSRWRIPRLVRSASAIQRKPRQSRCHPLCFHRGRVASGRCRRRCHYHRRHSRRARKGVAREVGRAAVGDGATPPRSPGGTSWPLGGGRASHRRETSGHRLLFPRAPRGPSMRKAPTSGSSRRQPIGRSRAAMSLSGRRQPPLLGVRSHVPAEGRPASTPLRWHSGSAPHPKSGHQRYPVPGHARAQPPHLQAAWPPVRSAKRA